MIPQKLSFEETYGDDSGVEKAVRYDVTQGDESDQIQLEHDTETITMSVDDIPWYIARLQYILNMVKGDGG